MRIDKLSQNLSIETAAKNIGNRVFLTVEPDVFEKSAKPISLKQSFLNKILFNKKFEKEIQKQTKRIANQYPDLEQKDIENLVKQALRLKQKPIEALKSLEEVSQILSDNYKNNVGKIKNLCKQEFSDIYSVDSIGTRSKSKSSVLSKLISKYGKGKLETLNTNEIAKGIGDGYGARIVLKNISKEKSQKVLEKALDNKMTYKDFIANVAKMDTLDEDTKKIVQKGLNKLKEFQTNEFVSKFIELLKKGTLELADDEFNNYGNEITSYFSDTQLKRIAHNYEEITHKPLTIVNKNNLDSWQRVELERKPEGFFQGIRRFINTNSEKATKSSGYTTTQANLKTNYTTGQMLADAEIQIRGKNVNNFAEIEHIPYDIRQGKKTEKIYDKIKTIMRGMSKESYEEYSKYLSDTYKYHRLSELGIEIPKPELTRKLFWAANDNLPKDLQNCVPYNRIIDPALIEKITEEGLLSLHK